MIPLAGPILAATLITTGAVSPAADTGAAPAVARAPDTVPAPAWRAALSGGFEAFASLRTPWLAWLARVERRDRRGTIAAEAVLDRRFSLWDAGGAVDVYHVLWRRAYGNVRVVAAPGARVIPRLDASAELYQGVGAGIEVSAGYRRMSYPGGGVDLWGASVAKYAGDWYLRVRGVAVPQHGELGGSLGLLVRRYLGTPDDLVDLSGAAGKEVVTVGPGPLLEVRTSTELALRLQRFVTPRLGLSLTGTYAAEQGIPARTGLTVGVVRRL